MRREREANENALRRTRGVSAAEEDERRTGATGEDESERGKDPKVVKTKPGQK